MSDRIEEIRERRNDETLTLYAHQKLPDKWSYYDVDVDVLLAEITRLEGERDRYKDALNSEMMLHEPLTEAHRIAKEAMKEKEG